MRPPTDNEPPLRSQSTASQLLNVVNRDIGSAAAASVVPAAGGAVAAAAGMAVTQAEGWPRVCCALGQLSLSLSKHSTMLAPPSDYEDHRAVS
jgi:uncharacterized protein (DUF697 family)